MPLREVSLGTGKNGGEAPLVDIIAVHGLNPKGKDNDLHAFDTWSKPKGGSGKLWLRDQLPMAVPNARIFIAVYDSNPVFGSKGRFFLQANTFLEEILSKRDSEDIKRPIVFIAHSLGGILVKQALVNAHNNSRYASIKQAVFGLIFFGVPHTGGNNAAVRLGTIATKIAGAVLPGASKDIMETLKDGSMYNDILNESFRNQLEDYIIVSFFERLEKFNSIIVPYESATLGLAGHRENQIGLEANHSDMCCFDNSKQHDRDIYELVEFNVKRTYRDAIKERTKGPGTNSRTATSDQLAEEFYKFGMALVDCTSEDPRDLKFRRGTLIEDIEVYAHGKDRILNGRIRYSRGNIQADTIVLIRENRLEKVLEPYSSHMLFDMALKRSWDFAEKLFSTRSDDLDEPQLTIGSTSLKTSFVDWNGQLHPQALHFAVIAQDYDMIEFLHDIGEDINKLAVFPSLFSKHPTDDRKNWEPYVSRRFGPPLTAAVNRYVRSKHLLQVDRQKAEVVSWRRMIQGLISRGADWSKFVDREELLGPHHASRADAPSVLWRAIDYDDRVMYGLILGADPPLDFEWLPWKPFFETEKWWVSFKPTVRSLKGEDARRVLEVLQKRKELALPNNEETLQNSIMQVMWGNFEDLYLSALVVNILFEQLMAHVVTWDSANSEEQQKTIVQQLEIVLKANPDLERWDKKGEYCSILHLCVANDLYDVLKLFLEHGKSAAFINYNFVDGDSLLDKAERHGEKAIVQLLKSHKAMPAQRTHESCAPVKGTRTRSSRTSRKPSRFSNTPQKSPQRLTITTQTSHKLVTPPMTRQATPFSPASSKFGSICSRSGNSTPARAISKARGVPKPEISTTPAESTVQVLQEDNSHYSDSDFQCDSSRMGSLASLQLSPQKIALFTPSDLSPTAQLLNGTSRAYSAALKDGLNPNIQWDVPRPKLPSGHNSFQSTVAKSTVSSSIPSGPMTRAYRLITSAHGPMTRIGANLGAGKENVKSRVPRK